MSGKFAKTGGNTKYEKNYIARVRKVILEFALLNDRGELAYSKIALALDVSYSTLRKWKNPKDEHYQPLFADAMKAAEKELHELIDLGQVKQAIIQRARGTAKKFKKTKELQNNGPIKPSFSMLSKKDLVEYARKVLGLKLKATFTKGGMIWRIEEAIVKQTKSRMVITSVVEEKLPPDVAAGKLVTTNIGPVEQRWTEKQRVDIESESLVDIIAKTGIFDR